MHEWAPDEMVTDAVLDGRRDYASLSAEDARWVVADLTERGYSSRQIAGWLVCSQRQVKRLRAELVTRVMRAFVRASLDRADAERRRAAAQDHVHRLQEDLVAAETRCDVGAMGRRRGPLGPVEDWPAGLL